MGFGHTASSPPGLPAAGRMRDAAPERGICQRGEPQGDSLPILKTNLNHFLQSMSGSETRIPALLLTQLLCLCHHFTAKHLWPFSLQNSGNGKGKGRFLSENLHLCSASHLLACMHWAVAEQVALQTTSHLALTFSYQSHLIKGVNSSIGSAQLVCTC